MKTVARILIILAVSVAIAGLALALANTTGVQASQTPGDQQSHAGQGTGSGQIAPSLGQAGLGPGHGKTEGGAFSITEMLKNLAIVAMIVLAVVALERLQKGVVRGRHARVAVSARQPGRKE
jgi:hypothetical protein